MQSGVDGGCCWGNILVVKTLFIALMQVRGLRVFSRRLQEISRHWLDGSKKWNSDEQTAGFDFMHRQFVPQPDVRRVFAAGGGRFV